MIEVLTKEKYEPPEIDVYQVGVERGFEASPTDSNIEGWTEVPGRW